MEIGENKCLTSRPVSPNQKLRALLGSHLCVKSTYLYISYYNNVSGTCQNILFPWTSMYDVNVLQFSFMCIIFCLFLYFWPRYSSTPELLQPVLRRRTATIINTIYRQDAKNDACTRQRNNSPPIGQRRSTQFEPHGYQAVPDNL